MWLTHTFIYIFNQRVGIFRAIFSYQPRYFGQLHCTVCTDMMKIDFIAPLCMVKSWYGTYVYITSFWQSRISHHLSFLRSISSVQPLVVLTSSSSSSRSRGLIFFSLIFPSCGYGGHLVNIMQDKYPYWVLNNWLCFKIIFRV